MAGSEYHCWVCEKPNLRLIRPSTLKNGELEPKDFAITDRRYGRIGALFRCDSCGFRCCPEIEQPLTFYEDLVDPDYERSKPQRVTQARRLLAKIRELKPNGRLFDVGAGGGNLLLEATKMGYSASGIEPSRWLWSKAIENGASELLGTLPREDAGSGFDIVTIIDVIEHVDDPVGLLRAAREILAADGILVVVTPDVGSLTARLMRSRWWHYRVAHIGYFNRSTVLHALERAGFSGTVHSRPGWYLSVGYILERLTSYLPFPALTFLNRRLTEVILPVNFFDSMMLVAVKA